ncbi:glycoside hydrolase family 15 protein [Halegenticoccus soli]|uniref:glycoside hydrolase family 15 protein n=1 Tax=Halegenticoccus soli TaxID=1985678 RepID=UPI001E435B29|nr:glycoside hydrolase family 15 protein [Halegenticoccus soli]
MQLRDALDDYKRNEGHDTRFPGERRSTHGLFSGLGGRLVHVDRDGSLRDFGYPLTGLNGVERSRFGLRRGGEVTWFDEFAVGSQAYHGDTALVVTEHVGEDEAVVQYDLALGDAHLTRFECGDEARDADAELVAYLDLAPNAQDTRIGQLRHEDAIEVYHTDEHDFVGSATGFAEVRGQVPARFEEVLAADPVRLPRPLSEDRYEEDRLSGGLVVFLPLESGGSTLVTLLTNETETPRERALARIAELTEAYDDVDTLRRAAAAETPVEVPSDLPYDGALTTDLRVLGLLSAETGLRIAGPDFDPHFAHSGGYGYTWFRDDAEISLFVRDAAEHFGLSLDGWTARSARAYVATQRDDGTWPHRVWPFDGSLAPGWANGRLEAGDDLDYQADQTGSVIAFLAAVLDDVDGRLEAEIEAALVAALDGLDDTLADDGRPVACQNAWEDMIGRFSHTTATFLEAYAALAATDLRDGDAAARAADRAHQVYESVDDLWVPERGVYALREYHEDAENGAYAAGDLDERYDSAALALASAHLTYARVGEVDDERIARLVSHVRETVDGLWHESDEGDVAGLVRYEGDEWRRRGQESEKVWTVSTAWGAHAAASLAALLSERGDDRAAEFAGIARELLALVLPDGPLCADTGYLPEQLFDDGTPDSATPLGWPHALRLATVALMDERGMLGGTGGTDDIDGVDADEATVPATE